MQKVKVYKDTEVRINGVQYIVKAGVQEVQEHLAEFLFQLSIAEPVVEEKKEERNDKRRRS